MTKMKQLILALTVLFAFTACSEKQNANNVIVSNSLAVERVNEIVTVPLSKLNILVEDLKGLKVVGQDESVALSQLVDSDKDGYSDMLLFQASIAANSEKVYTIVETDTVVSENSKVFSRFVPERTDDYAWENDKVAFRTYGPTAQKMAEEGVKGGTLSSGMDCWLKKVDYPIIDKWYDKHTTGKGSYHEDTGEGLDNFHVGSSRGCGGLGVFIDNELYTSKNFTDYNTLANGPIRTEFILDYENWKAGEQTIAEQKIISLDLGSNFMHITAKVDGTETITVGLTLHENDGQTAVDTVNGWFSYWQPHADSELGTAIVINPKYYAGYTKVESEEKDKSQLLVHLKVIDGKVDYKAGFGWKESGQFVTQDQWEDFLTAYAEKNLVPLRVDVE